MEADSRHTAPSHEPGHEKNAESPAESPAEPRFPGPGGIDRSRHEPDDARGDIVDQTEQLPAPHAAGANRVDADWADPDPEDPLAGIVDAIERLTHLDPADAAAPGTAIADILSRALEEEER